MYLVTRRRNSGLDGPLADGPVAEEGMPAPGDPGWAPAEAVGGPAVAVSRPEAGYYKRVVLVPPGAARPGFAFGSEAEYVSAALVPDLAAGLSAARDPLEASRIAGLAGTLGPQAIALVGPLSAWLASDDEIARSTAASALGDIGGEAAQTVLLSCLNDEPSPRVRENLAAALLQIDSPPALAGLYACLAHHDLDICTLGQAAGRADLATVGALVSAAAHCPGQGDLARVAGFLGRLDPGLVLPALEAQLHAANRPARTVAVSLLLALDAEYNQPYLRSVLRGRLRPALRDPDPAVARQAIDADAHLAGRLVTPHGPPAPARPNPAAGRPPANATSLPPARATSGPGPGVPAPGETSGLPPVPASPALQRPASSAPAPQPPALSIPEMSPPPGRHLPPDVPSRSGGGIWLRRALLTQRYRLSGLLARLIRPLTAMDHMVAPLYRPALGIELLGLGAALALAAGVLISAGDWPLGLLMFLSAIVFPFALAYMLSSWAQRSAPAWLRLVAAALLTAGGAIMLAVALTAIGQFYWHIPK
jgi:hypothetical protein